MTQKPLPFTSEEIQRVIREYGTPFHIYDERAIRENARSFLEAFSWAPEFREFFAVKATPNPHILTILKEEGLGADCSSLAELVLAERTGIIGDDIVFTSNDTPAEEFAKARELGAVINLDDIRHIEVLEDACGLPSLLSFRYNPGSLKTGNSIIGEPEEAKYGCTKEQLFEAYRTVRDKGVRRFGLHTMVASNELDGAYFVDTADMVFDMACELYRELGIRIELINLGGGIGIPYRPEEEAVDIGAVSEGIRRLYEKKISGTALDPIRIAMECGRVITGPYGYLVSTVLHIKETYKTFAGLDACMADLMRPAIYGAYHHISVLGEQTPASTRLYDVTGSLCENNDKFAIDRELPELSVGDTLVIHDTGAHGHAMGFNYNGKLRSAELLLRPDGSVKLIRRAETIDDYFSTLDFSNLRS